MEFNESDPLYYTSKESDAQIRFNKGVSIFMLAVCLLFVFFTWLFIYDGLDEDGDIVALIAVVFVAVIMGAGAIGVHYVTNHHKRLLRQFQLYDDRIDEKVTYPKKGTEEINRIHFDHVDRIIVGVFSETSFSVIKKKLMDIFQPDQYFALLVVVYQETYFPKRIFSQDEMDQWLDTFKRADLPVFYTENDLGLAYVGYTKRIDIPFEDAADTLLPEDDGIRVDQPMEGAGREKWRPEALSDYWTEKHKKVRTITLALSFLVAMPLVYSDVNDMENLSAAVMVGTLLIPLFGLLCRKRANLRDLVYIYLATSIGGTIGGILFYLVQGNMDLDMLAFPWGLHLMLAVVWIAFFLIARLVWYVLRKQRKLR